jgi:glycosyltransferase involved in cell wall biosynthesis
MKSHPKDIVYLTTSLGVGGGAKRVTEVSRILSCRGWRVGVIVIVSGDRSKVDPEKVSMLDTAGVSVKVLGLKKSAIGAVYPMLKLLKILNEWQPHILSTNMVHANLLGRIIRPITRTPHVISTAVNINEGSRIRELAYRLTDYFCDATIHVSELGARHYVKIGAVPAMKISVIHNGVDVEKFKPDPEVRKHVRGLLGVDKYFVWFLAGRFVPQKNHLGTIEAFAKSNYGKSKKSVLLLAGQGPLLDDVKNKVDELGVKDQVLFLGVRRDISDLMNASDGYVMPSEWEGLSNVLLEAASCGLPIVTTDVGGNREIVVDGETGFLVPRGDLGSLVKAMDKLTALKPEIYSEMCFSARARTAGVFGQDIMIDEWENLYRRFIVRTKKPTTY